MKRILIIEDDDTIREELKTLLCTNGYQPVDTQPCDLVLLDVNLPGENGFTLCRKLRQTSDIPVIFLTARDTPEDELLAFGVGGDDFIRKPYNSAVLLARIGRVLKNTANDVLTVRGLTLDLPGMKAVFERNAVELTKNETRILWCLMQKEFSLISIFLLTSMMVVMLFIVIEWKRSDRRIRRLKSRLEKLPEKYLIGEIMDRPRDAVELEYFLLMKEMSRSAIGAVEQARAEKQDYYDYVESWVHEMKTPLTACSLILSNGGDTVKLRRELKRADNLTETILTYAKLRTAQKDTQISFVNLRAICDQAVREEMELLIASDIGILIDGECAVYTDSKLLVFILKQLLINCAKYCPGCQIHLLLSDGRLTFSDNGPGIPSHELRRVTERGFTGTLGRSYGQSTGMGLYIVSELCKILNIDLEVASEEHRFTRFLFSFHS